MDCGTIRQQLDAIRPDSDDRSDAGLREASAHLDRCSHCREVFEARQEFDREVGRQMRDVPLPEGLKERLLAALQAAPPVSPGSREPAARRPSRRRPLRAWPLVAAGLLAAVALGWAVLRPGETPLSLEAARTTVAEQMANERLDPFDGSFDATVNPTWSGLLKLTPECRGIDVNGSGRHDAAVYGFSARVGHRPLKGTLVVFATGRISNPPVESAPISSNVFYSPQPGVVCLVGNQVYLCYVEGDRSDLDALFDLFKGLGAA
jgi:hypothetical protein